ncbi:MAG: hypothetical protein H8F28_18175 [Fibrella sp.]|nr:hypothetical protein [Armatimonadota bacterium]
MKYIPTLQQRIVRRRRIAIVTIIASLGIACRWHVANLEPAYPVGEGVYKENTVSETGETKQPNAALFYMAAAGAFHIDMPEGLEQDTHSLISAPLSVQEPVVAQAKPAFDLLRQGMKYSFVADKIPGYFVEESSVGKSIPTRNFAPLREMSRMLAVESRVKAAKGDTPGALQSALDAMRLGTDAGQGASLLEGMIGVLLQRIGTQEAIRHVKGLSAAEARAGASRLEAMLKHERTFAQMMTAERDTMSYDTLKTVFRTGAFQGMNPNTGEELDLQGAGWRFALGTMVFARTKQGVVDDFAEQYDQILTRYRMPYQLAKRLDKTQLSANPMVRYWVDTDVQRAYHQTTQQATHNRVLLAQLAIQAYRQEHGGVAPTSLSDLTRGTKPYISVVPGDPFSLPGTHALRYDAHTGKAYSVGENGKDDRNAGDDNSGLYNE